jgi:hypothetical protein
MNGNYAMLLMKVSRGEVNDLYAAAKDVLKAETKVHRNANINTLKKLNILTIHTAQNVMTLSSVSLDNVMTLSTAKIPLKWEERSHWFQMFNFLALLMVRFQFVFFSFS